MSFTTRCPACGTTFRVVPDQLKISDGWVRCGHCADVFDATLFLDGHALVPTDAVATHAGMPARVTSVQVGPAHKVAVTAPLCVSSDSDGDGDWLLRPRPRRQIPVTPAPAAPGPSVIPAQASPVSEWDSLFMASEGHPSSWAQSDSVQDDFSSELQQFASRSGPLSVAPDSVLPPSGHLRSPASPSMPATNTPAEPPAAAPRGRSSVFQAPVDDDLSVEPEPGFLRQARRKAFWHSPVVRAGLLAVVSMMAFALLIQWALFERDRLAARYPGSVPALGLMCQAVGCQIGPVREIESVVIESSNLVRRLGSFYSFDLVLKNSAGTPVAVPALELSLTDNRDTVIARRVFLPEELPGLPALLPTQGTASTSLRLSIADSGVSAMTGYRALLFYP